MEFGTGSRAACEKVASKPMIDATDEHADSGTAYE